MSDYAVKKIDEMEAVYLGAFKRARAELGVEAFGMAVIDLPPRFENYPEHDHTHDNQEEVFLVLRGGGEIEIDGERFPLDSDHVSRVGPETKRKLWPGPDGVRVVIFGGVPGAVYEAPDVSKLGEPDPMAAS
jgi:mannose-6-phosphate isomerase-like protein (cupin superfamily)